MRQLVAQVMETAGAAMVIAGAWLVAGWHVALLVAGVGLIVAAVGVSR